MKTSSGGVHLLRWIEGAPGVIFFLLLVLGLNPAMVAWIAAALAVLVLAGFAFQWRACHPVLLGLNLYLVLAPPVIVALFAAGYPGIAQSAPGYAHIVLLAVIFVTGAGLSLVTASGFIGAPEAPRSIRWRFNLLMLICAAGAMAATASFKQAPGLAVAAAVIVLCVLRDYLARLATASSGKDDA